MNTPTITTQRGSTASFFDMGQRLFNMGAYSAAIRALEIAVTRSENASTAYELLSKCYAELEMPESARQANMVAKRLGRA